MAKIIPAYKQDDAFLPSNYRPISLLFIFDKPLEKIICVRLKHGFRENHSTSHVLIDEAEYIYLSYCSFVCTGGLFLIIVRQAKRSGVYLTL